MQLRNNNNINDPNRMNNQGNINFPNMNQNNYQNVIIYIIFSLINFLEKIKKF